MGHALPDVAITGAGVRQVSASTIATVGAYVVVVATVLPNRAITLTSCYFGRQGADSAATHLLLAVDEPPRLEHRLLPGPQPGVTAPRVCLLDHVAELQAALALPGQPGVQIDLGPARAGADLPFVGATPPRVASWRGETGHGAPTGGASLVGGAALQLRAVSRVVKPMRTPAPTGAG